MPSPCHLAPVATVMVSAPNSRMSSAGHGARQVEIGVGALGKLIQTVIAHPGQAGESGQAALGVDTPAGFCGRINKCYLLTRAHQRGRAFQARGDRHQQRDGTAAVVTVPAFQGASRAAILPISWGFVCSGWADP